MSDDQQVSPERFAEAWREPRSKLNDEQLDALDELMEGLLSLGIEERRQMCDQIIAHLKEIMENQKPIN